MQYTVDYFISKFEKIPEDKWHVGWFVNRTGDKFCAAGHCGCTALRQTSEGEALDRVIDTLGDYATAAKINDGSHEKYRQSHPKQRILAALRDIKQMQESSQMLNSGPNVQECDTIGPIVVQELGQYKNISKQIAVLPVDEKSDVKIVKV